MGPAAGETRGAGAMSESDAGAAGLGVDAGAGPKIPGLQAICRSRPPRRLAVGVARGRRRSAPASPGCNGRLQAARVAITGKSTLPV